MSDTTQNLERNYATFKDQEDPFIFFKGLGFYLDVVFLDSILKKQFDKYLEERRVLYKEIEDVEDKSIKELLESKKELLTILEKDKIDVLPFKRIKTEPFGENSNILEELESYEKGESVGSGTFISDEIDKFLFDISANLIDLGYEKPLKNFLVSPKEYSAYHSQISGPSMYVYIRKDNYYFVFSNTLPKRWEKVRNFEHERILKLWGSFEKLFQYKIAYDFVIQPNQFRSVPQNGIENSLWFGASKEITLIRSMVQELQFLTENQLKFSTSVTGSFSNKSNKVLKELNVLDFKNTLQVVHSHLVAIVGIEEEEKSDSEGLKFVNTWKKGDKLSFDRDASIIYLGNAFCEIPHGSNQNVLCKGIFSEAFGEWIKETDLIKDFYKGDLGKQSFYDAIRAVNEKFKKAFGISGFLEYKASRVRISDQCLGKI